jgi:hypothetical protein
MGENHLQMKRLQVDSLERVSATSSTGIRDTPGRRPSNDRIVVNAGATGETLSPL